MYTIKKINNYESKLNLRETEQAIKLIKDNFALALENNLNLERISAPMFVQKNTGLNDDLNGIERAVSFDIKEIDGCIVEIVHSLAKWKRVALKEYGFNVGEGLYTDMNAIRRDDSVDNIHSIYVDQWDWEMVIDSSQRTIEFLKTIVKKIVNAIYETNEKVKKSYKCVTTDVCNDVYFISSQELESLYPDMTAKQRENAIVEKYKTVFIMQIGDKLASGVQHDGRAPDYDDWKLNGDLMVWNTVLGEALELSSMGIRVNAESLKCQLEKSNKTERMKFSYHKNIIENNLPLTIGGGIGQSRLCMFMLGKSHIGEVQVSVWPQEMIDECKKLNIRIL